MVCDAAIRDLQGEVGAGNTHVADVYTSDTAAAEVPDTLNHLVDDFASVRLQTQSHLHLVGNALGVLSSDTLKSDIGTTAVNHLLQSADNSLALLQVGKVNSLDPWVLGLDKVKTPVLVNHDDSLCAVHERKVGTHLTDGTSTPNGNGISFVDVGVDNTVPAGCYDIGQVQSLLIWDIVGDLEEVDIAEWNASVLGLTTSESASEMAVSEHTGGATTVHAVLDCVGVGLLALR